jgi:dihydroorotate dehydrogenase electron transfer subunit
MTSTPYPRHRPFAIDRIRVENYRTRTFYFRRPLPAQPGQFVMAWLPDLDEKPFSLACAEPLALTVVAVGPFSQALHALEAGDRVWIRGPLGRGFEIEGRRLLLVGGGYGVAPLLFLAREAVALGCRVTACIGAQTAADVLLVDDLTSAGASVHIATEDGSLGTRGMVTTAAETSIQARRPDAVYACGPASMLEAVGQLCRSYQLPHQLSWEAMIRCGLGLCGSCELPHGTGVEPGWLVCADGPVSSHL